MQIKRQDIIDLNRNPMTNKNANTYSDNIERCKDDLTRQFRARLDEIPHQFWTFKNSFVVDLPINIE